MRVLCLILSFFLAACADDATSPVTSSPGTSTTVTTNGEIPDSPSSADRSKTPESANAGNVTITSPSDGSVLTANPVEVAGTARTFENNVVLVVLDEDGDQILQTSTTARGDMGQFNPWNESLWLTRAPGKSMTIRALEHSAKDGSLRSFDSVTLKNGLEQREVTLFFPNTRRSPNDCSIVYPITHVVPSSVGMARLLTEALIAGPTRFQQAQGFTSEFPPGARVDSVVIDGSTVTVDFSPEMQNVGGSCRVQAIRASLEKTLTQLPNIDKVRITAGGSEELALQP